MYHTEKNIKICARCIYDENVPGIVFDDKGICNYCHQVEDLEKEYKTGLPEGEQKFKELVETIKENGKTKKYDCVVGISGGTDSSYMLYKAVDMGLRPLAVNYDNTWSTTIANENIRKLTKKLGVDLYTYVVDNKEMDDIYRAFLKASVPAIDIPTDIALTEVLYRAASQHNLKYILEGHSYKTEGVAPIGYSYFDGRYIKSIHDLYGSMKMKTFPNMTLLPFLKWILIKRIRKIRPLWYINYSKEYAREFLAKNFNWTYYGGHHLENRMTAFSISYHNPYKFNMDQRNLSLSASVRLGLLPRERALEIYNSPPEIDPDLLEYIKQRLNYTDTAFENMMKDKPRSVAEFKTYKKTFEAMRPFFWIMYKNNFVPKSFYLRYACKDKNKQSMTVKQEPLSDMPQ
ncbi:MAG: N-acetyl sugar amidotransferase [Bacteroidales bacterium]|nr:N-acetyl sugar amidotransferase [Bacteroidales bacterium]